MILPDSAGSAAHPHLVVGGGKTAPIYLVDRDNMGRFNGMTGKNQIVQQFNGRPGGDRDTTPAFFNDTLIYLRRQFADWRFHDQPMRSSTPQPVETPDMFDNKGGATACISANGTNNGIVWAIYNSGGESPATPVCFAGLQCDQYRARNFMPATNSPRGTRQATRSNSPCRRLPTARSMSGRNIR